MQLYDGFGSPRRDQAALSAVRLPGAGQAQPASAPSRNVSARRWCALRAMVCPIPEGPCPACRFTIVNQILRLVQLVPAVAPGVLAVEQHVQRAPDGGGHPRPVAVERAQLGSHHGQVPIAGSTVIGSTVIGVPVGCGPAVRRVELQAGQRGLPADDIGGRRHARQGELTGDGLGIAANLLADGLGGGGGWPGFTQATVAERSPGYRRRAATARRPCGAPQGAGSRRAGRAGCRTALRTRTCGRPGAARS